MLKAIVFDYNGVLLNDLEYQIESYWQAGLDRGFDLSRDTVKHYISFPPVQKKDLYFGEISEADWKSIFDLKEKYYYELIDTKDILFPDVEQILASLARQFKLALVSNTIRSLFERTFPRHLADLFQVTLFVDEVKEPKPSPQPLLSIFQTLDVSKDECCYVGDSVEDIRMAKAAGVKIFSMLTGICSEAELVDAGADCLVADLKDLVGQLKIANV
jgi:HAD superfamily hydrolase (TIGR01549 family)